MAVHVLDRLSFGPYPGEIERVRAMGWQVYVEEQLAPEKMALPRALTDRLAALPTQSMDTVALFRAYGPKPPGGPRKTPTLDEINQAKEKAAVIQNEAAEARLWRAILSPRQLEELLVGFWCNHFNVPASKGLAHLWVGSFEREAVRPHVLGRFEDMLLAATRHPAMLIHLENWLSASPESPAGKALQRPLAELHARELLSSHTMGADAKPKAQDVQSLALILAGWTVGSPRTPQDGGGFTFDERRHDMRDKPFLGQTVKGQGVAEGVEALKLLAARPETARSLAGKLARFFVADAPPRELEERLAKAWLDSGGDLRVVLGALFASPEFADARFAGTKFKNPERWLVSVARAASRPVVETRSLAEHLEWLDMPLYDAPGTSGFRDAQEAWLTAEGLLKRLNLAVQAGQGGLPCWSPGTWRALEPLDAQTLAAVMGRTPSPDTAQALRDAAPDLKAGVFLGSPEAQRH
ncbi:DUF1800 domain-containing protein [Fundidesulfovibrio magnetotacticus]|nr:DUF1800 domain-containing protein [Fundidesulfovibrio magnetotacticus]